MDLQIKGKYDLPVIGLSVSDLFENASLEDVYINLTETIEDDAPRLWMVFGTNMNDSAIVCLNDPEETIVPSDIKNRNDKFLLTEGVASISVEFPNNPTHNNETVN